MRRNIFTLIIATTMALTANAMGYTTAREEALFLTDKMAYELNLNDMQREAAYEINLDYLLSINGRADIEGASWARRNSDLRYVLSDMQYRLYLAASYFYRPLYWHGSGWRFSIYNRYHNRHHFYYGRPHAWGVYRGGHSRAPHSYYSGRSYYGHGPGHGPSHGHGPSRGHGHGPSHGHGPGHGNGHGPGHGPSHGPGHGHGSPRR